MPNTLIYTTGPDTKGYTPEVARQRAWIAESALAVIRAMTEGFDRDRDCCTDCYVQDTERYYALWDTYWDNTDH